MPKKKKKNKKKNRDLSLNNPTTPLMVLNSAPQIDLTTINFGVNIKKDLTKILVIMIILMIILIGAVIIKQKTSWISSSANWFYSSMRLGE